MYSEYALYTERLARMADWMIGDRIYDYTAEATWHWGNAYLAAKAFDRRGDELCERILSAANLQR